MYLHNDKDILSCSVYLRVKIIPILGFCWVTHLVYNCLSFHKVHHLDQLNKYQSAKSSYYLRSALADLLWQWFFFRNGKQLVFFGNRNLIVGLLVLILSRPQDAAEKGGLHVCFNHLSTENTKAHPVIRTSFIFIWIPVTQTTFLTWKKKIQLLLCQTGVQELSLMPSLLTKRERLCSSKVFYMFVSFYLTLYALRQTPYFAWNAHRCLHVEGFPWTSTACQRVLQGNWRHTQHWPYQCCLPNAQHSQSRWPWPHLPLPGTTDELGSDYFRDSNHSLLCIFIFIREK